MRRILESRGGAHRAARRDGGTPLAAGGFTRASRFRLPCRVPPQQREPPPRRPRHDAETRAPRGPPAPLAARYASVRAASLALAAPLSAEDCQVQSMPDASPTKWHLAHITWFFETFLLERFEPASRPSTRPSASSSTATTRPSGEQHPRPQRGLLSRPDLADVKRYRAHVDERMQRAARQPRRRRRDRRARQLGLHHEQQHQELHPHRHQARALVQSRSQPAYARRWPMRAGAAAAAALVRLRTAAWSSIGHAGARRRFCFDNETPRHRAFAAPFELASRPVTLRRVPRLHRRRRLPPARAVAVDGLGLGPQPARAARRSTGSATAADG